MNGSLTKEDFGNTPKVLFFYSNISNSPLHFLAFLRTPKNPFIKFTDAKTHGILKARQRAFNILVRGQGSVPLERVSYGIDNNAYLFVISINFMHFSFKVY